MLNDNATVLDGETGMDLPDSSDFPGLGFSSGGSFSNYFPRPEYQKAAVDQYFAKHDPGYPYYEIDLKDIEGTFGANGGLYNRGGRVGIVVVLRTCPVLTPRSQATPDVSANGAKLGGYLNGTSTSYSGTSLSAPLFASILTLVPSNDPLEHRSGH